MELGSRLREIRKKQGMTMAQVAAASGLTRSFISQIESNAARPSIGALKRIGDALGITLGSVLDDEPTGAADSQAAGLEPHVSSVDRLEVVRSDQRKMLVWPGRRWETFLLTPDLQRKLEVILDVMEPGDGKEEPYAHRGEEFGLVLEGQYEVTVDGETVVLEAGDAVYYPSHLPHSTRVIGDRPAKTLWVITPPSF